METPYRWSVILLALVFVTVFAGKLLAQYTRTETTAAYQQRTGASVTGQLFRPANDDNAMLVQLPFNFPYFDRTYRNCWMSTNGRISFWSAWFSFDASIPSNLATSNIPDMIYAIGGDLLAQDENLTATLGVYFESGRVVLQWSNAATASGMGCHYLNFQVHLLANGNIEMHYGPENPAPGLTDDTSFVSGIVNHNGGAYALGFGNTATQQTTRPAPNTVVTLVPTMTQANTVTINQNPMLARTFITPPATNVPVLSFKLVACGNGTTVTTLDFAVPDISVSGDTIDLSLVADTGTIGQYDGETVLASMTASTTMATLTGLSETLAAGQTRDYLLLASFSAMSIVPFNSFGCYDGTPNTITGQAFCETVQPAAKGMAYFAASRPALSRPAAVASSQYNRLCCFTIVQDPDSPAFNMTSMEFDLTVTGMNYSDVSRLQLFRDDGTVPGERDIADTLLQTLTGGIAATNTFNTIVEATSLAGTRYLLTASIASAFTGTGTMYVTWQTPVGGAPVAGWVDDGEVVQVCGTAATLAIREVDNLALYRITAAPSETGVHASVFELAAATGAGTVSELTFAESWSGNSQLSDARLYLDNGTVPGRQDSGDTLQVATVTLSTAGAQLVLAAPLAVTATPTRMVLVVDIASNSNAGMRFSLENWNVVSTFTDVVGRAHGTDLDWRMGGANGVDLTVQVLDTSVDLYLDNRPVIARVICEARGTGGYVPSLSFRTVNCFGGFGANNNVYFQFWLEGNGPLGQVDSSDRLCYPTTHVSIGQLDLQHTFMPVLAAGQTRNFLLVARHMPTQFFEMPGTFDLSLDGYSSGSDVRWMPAGEFTMPLIAINFHNTNAPAKKKGDGGDDSACSTGTGSGNWVGLFSALAAMLAASRLRRSSS